MYWSCRLPTIQPENSPCFQAESQGLLAELGRDITVSEGNYQRRTWDQSATAMFTLPRAAWHQNTAVLTEGKATDVVMFMQDNLALAAESMVVRMTKFKAPVWSVV